MIQPQTIRHFQTVTLRPHWMQFVINELPWLVLCGAGWGYWLGWYRQGWLAVLLLMLSTVLLYRLTYLCRVKYRITSEQLMVEYGVFTHSQAYIELYRVVDYDEHRSFMQQLTGMKTVSIYSGDRTTPRLDIIGMDARLDIVGCIRERVEYNKQRKGIYEITNR